MITSINKIFLAFQQIQRKAASNTLLLPIFLFIFMILFAILCLTQNINLFSE